MKYLFSIAIFFASCSKPSTSTYPQYFSLEQVKTIAAGYGLEDMVTMEKNAGLMYLTQEELDKYFTREKGIRDKQKEMVVYFEKTKDVHSFEDYLALIQSLPLVYNQEVELKGGPEKFQEWVAQRRLTKWHIYCDEKGVLSWVTPEYDKDHDIAGERLDRNR